MAVWLLNLPAIGLAQQIAIGEYPIPTARSYPGGITAGPDGALWFTEPGAGKIGRITTAGVITEYPVPNVLRQPQAIAAGPDGALWFSEWDKIGRITTTGIITEYSVPTAGSCPWGITAGPDGALWFTEYYRDKIGRITTSGAVTEYSLPMAGSAPWAITAGPDGALWFTEAGYYAKGIGRITTTGIITEYSVPTAHNTPWGITAGPDGALWFTETWGKIGRITTAGAFTEYPVPTAESAPYVITAGPDGALWFTEPDGNQIGRITTAGVITEYPVPTTGGRPVWITAGPDGALWFTEYYGNKIGQVVIVTAGLSVGPTSGVFRTNLIFSGSSFTPDENVQIYAFGVGSRVLARATADGGGSFTATARNSQSPYGHRLFLAMGQTSGKLGAADFSMAPRVILSPNAGTVGSRTAASGVGFGSLETVEIYWNSTLLGTATANVSGTFTGATAFRFRVPAQAPLGVNKVYGKGQTTGAIGGGSFTVE